MRELQRELTRAGCYGGAINGLWAEPTRQAMNRLVQSANAKLPTLSPDAVHLALARSQPEQACDPGPESGESAHRVLRTATAVKSVAAVDEGSNLAPLPPTSENHRKKPARFGRRGPPIEGRMGVGVGVIPPARGADRAANLGAVQPEATRSTARKRRAAHYRHRAVAHARQRHLRPMRPARYAYRPRGFISLLFGF